MKIRIVHGMTGPDITYHSGSIQDVDEGFASSLVAAGYAEYVGKPEDLKPSGPPAKRSIKSTSKRAKASEKR